MESGWDIKKIKEILPQRFPFLFIDKVIDVDAKKQTITCLKNVSVNDSFFKGHFPGNPIMPGVIILEALAQASIIIYSVLKPDIAKKNPDYFLGKVEAKYKKPVHVGDQLMLRVNVRKITDKGAIVEARASVADELKAVAHIVFGVKSKE